MYIEGARCVYVFQISWRALRGQNLAHIEQEKAPANTPRLLFYGILTIKKEVRPRGLGTLRCPTPVACPARPYFLINGVL